MKLPNFCSWIFVFYAVGLTMLAVVQETKTWRMFFIYINIWTILKMDFFVYLVWDSNVFRQEKYTGNIHLTPCVRSDGYSRSLRDATGPVDVYSRMYM